MSEEKDKPVLIDADFVVEYKDGEIVPVNRGVLFDPKTDRLIKKTTKSLVKHGFSAVLWTVRQVGGIMMEGIGGTIDGVKEAAESESKYDNKRRYTRGDLPETSRRRTRPIWDIPTKEEEERERRMKYG